MQYVKFTKAQPGIAEGAVRQVDDASAAKLIERGDAKTCGAPGPARPLDHHARGNLAVTQVVTADLPTAEPPEVVKAAKAKAENVGAAGGPAHT